MKNSIIVASLFFSATAFGQVSHKDIADTRKQTEKDLSAFYAYTTPLLSSCPVYLANVGACPRQIDSLCNICLSAYPAIRSQCHAKYDALLTDSFILNDQVRTYKQQRSHRFTLNRR